MHVGVLTGAGVSVAAGIPDFRSPTGMYATLPIDRLTATDREKAAIKADPVMVVDSSMFRKNQFPYLEVRRPFILGTQQRKWRATATHRLFELLAKHGKLTRLFTQNIDGLDYQTSIPADLIVPVHGSLGAVACEWCKAPMDFDEFCEEVRTKVKDIYDVDESAPTESTNIACPSCGKAGVKPTTVLYGSSLPEAFFEHFERDVPTFDLLIIAGTSLTVGPANQVAAQARHCPRVIINNEPVGLELGIEYDNVDETGNAHDVFLRGSCDDVARALIHELGWADESNRNQIQIQTTR